MFHQERIIKLQEPSNYQKWEESVIGLLEMKKLVRIMDDDFIMLEASHQQYEQLMADQWTANSLIHASLEKSIDSQYLGTSIDLDLIKLSRVLREVYNGDLVLDSDHVQEEIMNLQLENEGSVVVYVSTLRWIYRELEQYGSSDIQIDIFDTLARGLPSDGEMTKCQIQTMVNAERKHYVRGVELKR